MTKQKLDEQIGCLSAVYYVTLEAANLMASKLELLMFQDNQTFAHEAKMHLTMIKQGMKRTKQGLDFFESNVLPLLVTDDGKTDSLSTSNALLNDANQIVRTLCKMYNKNVKSTKISDDIINSFNLKHYENEGTSVSGNTSPE